MVKKVKLSYAELIEENKKQLMNDKDAIDKIERKIEERQLNTNQVKVKN
ncbi:MAG: FbpB family small basic protein [Bacillus sp. (in: Bacteria)]|nr:FbpB family small basic protein [Bacillus sp. (in: firmicutes)]